MQSCSMATDDSIYFFLLKEAGVVNPIMGKFTMDMSQSRDVYIVFVIICATSFSDLQTNHTSEWVLYTFLVPLTTLFIYLFIMTWRSISQRIHSKTTNCFF